MNQWADPRFIITLLLIVLFGIAYASDTSDQAMKGAIIGAFSAAYGFWIGSKTNDKATENTGKAFDAITAAATGVPAGPIDAHITNRPNEPVPTTNLGNAPQASPDARSAPPAPSRVPDTLSTGSASGEAPSGSGDDLPKDPSWQ